MQQRYYSGVYWHFVGRPKIGPYLIESPNDYTKKGRRVKNPSESFDIVKNILKTKTLLATATEAVAFGDKVINSDKFCCVTDIPLKDLELHGTYYGHTAIGFTSKAIHRDEWNPVWYINPKQFMPLQFSGFMADVLSSLRQDTPPIPEAQVPEDPINRSINIALDSWISDFRKNILNWIKVTRFSSNPGESFYHEREWRHIGDFHFQDPGKDIVAIIVPARQVRKTKELLRTLLLRSVSVVSWDLIHLG